MVIQKSKYGNQRSRSKYSDYLDLDKGNDTYA